MDQLRNIALIEHGFLSRDHFHNKRRILRQPAEILTHDLLVLLHHLGLNAARLHVVDGGAAMRRRLQRNVPIFEAAMINRRVISMRNQMTIDLLRPGCADLGKTVLPTREVAIDDLPFLTLDLWRPSDRLTVTIKNRNPFWAKACLGQRPQRHHDVNMRIACSIMIVPVCHLPAGRELIAHIVTNQSLVLLYGQLNGQRDDELVRELSVIALFAGFDTVPEMLGKLVWRISIMPGMYPPRGAFGQCDFTVDTALLSTVVGNLSGARDIHMCRVAICCGSNGTLPFATGYLMSAQMIDRHETRVPSYIIENNV